MSSIEETPPEAVIFILNRSVNSLYRPLLVPCIAPSLEISVHINVCMPIFCIFSQNSNASNSDFSSQPLIATLPSLISTPTAIFSLYFLAASLTNASSCTAAVPRITLSRPASIYLSMTAMVLMPPPISQKALLACFILLTVSKLGVPPSFAPSRSTICICGVPHLTKSSAICHGLSLYMVICS